MYIANDFWRWTLSSFPSFWTTKLGGINAGFHGNAFIRPSVIAENRITTPTDEPLLDAKQRDLVYFISFLLMRCEQGTSVLLRKI